LVYQVEWNIWSTSIMATIVVGWLWSLILLTHIWLMILKVVSDQVRNAWLSFLNQLILLLNTFNRFYHFADFLLHLYYPAVWLRNFLSSNFVFEVFVIPDKQVLISYDFLLLSLQLFDFYFNSLIPFVIVLLKFVDAIILLTLKFFVDRNRIVLFWGLL